MLDKTPDQLLDDGAALLDREGWTRHSLQEPGGRQRCALGAIYTASSGERADHSARTPVVDVAVAALVRHLDALHVPHERRPEWFVAECRNHARIADWNNGAHCTKREVTSAMRAAAALLRAEREAADALARAASAPADAVHAEPELMT
jgi:hypothetical protein